MIKVLIIDDGEDLTNYCHQWVSNGFEYDHIKSGKNLARDLKGRDYNLILLDKNFSRVEQSELLGPAEDVENEGLRILTALKRLNQNIPVIMVTAHADYDSMSSALHLGAFDYVEWDALERDYLFLKLKMERAVEWEKSTRKDLVEKYNNWGLIGKSEVMVKLFQQVETVLASDSTLLLLGETGTGKDLVAKIIHSNSKRASKPFISVNCAAIPATLLEEQLFGHEKGTFTDAKERKAGKFEIANGGIIFLNEIGELPKKLQPKLLKVIEEKKVDPLGASKPIQVDVRIISATNRNIEKMVQEGNFRSDLYYRLKVLEIKFPPLRERMEDLPLLIDHFIHQKSKLMDKEIAGITREASNYLYQKKWEGNIRELENLIEGAVKKADRLITLKDLLEAKKVPREKLSPQKTCSREIPDKDCPVFKDADMSQIEKVAILNALRAYQGHVEPASKALGISKATMYNKINQYGLSHLVKRYAERGNEG